MEEDAKRTKHVSALRPEDLELLRRAIRKGNGDRLATFEALKEELKNSPSATPELKEAIEKISEKYRETEEN